MQQVTFTNSRNGRIVGTLYPGHFNTLIIMAHGFTNNQSSQGRFEKLAQSFQHAGFSALTFDFSGCGKSVDDRITASKQVDDLKCAIAFAISKGYQQIALYGHSLGSLICLRSFSPEIKTMVLSGALTGPMYYDWSAYYSTEQMDELAEKGYITVPKSEGTRKQVLIDKQMLADFAEIDQKELLQPVTCPVLIIHGNHVEDEEENLLCQHSMAGMKYLSSDSKLEIIDGATHRFSEHIDILCEMATAWFDKYLS
ncbi:alpha/beta hydrolase family protein [Brevibacillus sp. SYSU BS000544]|uniref:alpha/beta hydrolase family protein n=1 Tax=Brevibacillus sp. SYSU BS000544 TaxID=3416443 RepID=UPI003CE488B2